MTAGTLHRMGDVFERCACCGSTHEVAHIMYPEGWPVCKPCTASGGPELLRDELYGGDAA